MNARRTTAAILTIAAVTATLLASAPQAEAVRYSKITQQATNVTITNKSGSNGTIQLAKCNRSKDSCPIVAVLSPGQTGPKGAYWGYVQSGKKATMAHATRAGGRWADYRYLGGGASWLVVNA